MPVIGFSLFPSAGIPQFTIDIEAPEGASLAETDRALRFVEAELAKRPEVAWWFANLGRGNPRVYYNVLPAETRANFAEVFAELADYDPQAHAARCSTSCARVFRGYPAARITVQSFENGPPIAAPIAIRISGPSSTSCASWRRASRASCARRRATRDVDNPVRLRRTDLDLAHRHRQGGAARRAARPRPTARPPRDRGAAGDALSARPTATNTTSRCACRMDAGRQTLAALDAIQIGTASGAKVPLQQLADPQFRTAPAHIQRHDREREVTITAYPRTGSNTARMTRAIVARARGRRLAGGLRLHGRGRGRGARRRASRAWAAPC